MHFTHPRLEDVALPAILHALADPARLQIVAALAGDREAGGDGLSCSEAACPELARATMSNHFTILRSAGLIESRKAGVRVVNRLRREEVEAHFPGLLEVVLRAGKAAEAPSPAIA